MNDEMLSLQSTGGSVIGEDYLTPVSSVDDLMALSPRSPKKSSNYYNNMTDDLLTGTELDEICDVTMNDCQGFDDAFLDSEGIDYLVKRADSTNRNMHLIDKGKESLFVKFDPLYAKNKNTISTTQKVSLNKTVPSDCDIGYETESSMSVTADQCILTPKRTSSSGSILLNMNKDKPMQIVPPAVNHTICSVNTTQTRSLPVLVRSVSAIMSPAQVAIDRLINITGSTPPVQTPSRISQQSQYNTLNSDRLYSLRVILQKQEDEIMQLRKENRDLKNNLNDMENSLARYKEEMEHKVRKLIEDKDKYIDKVNKLTEQINEKIRSNKQMSIVMEEYEKTISSLIGEQQTENTQNQEIQQKLALERDQALNHLANMETSFNDLLAKYEKCKSTLIEVKEREIIFEGKISEYEEGIKKYESLYMNLKQVTKESLEKANESLENIKKSHSTEITKFNATIKKQDIVILSLQESLAQKTRDIAELTAICDELINKVP